MDGRSHAYFDERAEAPEALRAIQIEGSEELAQLYLVGYDSNGKRVYGPEAAADALSAETTLQP